MIFFNFFKPFILAWAWPRSKHYLHRTAVTGSLSHHCDHVPNTTQLRGGRSYWDFRFRRANPVLGKHGGRRGSQMSCRNSPHQKAGEVTSVWLTFSSLPFHSVQDPRPRHSTAHIQSRSSLISYPSLETPSQTDVCPRRCEIQPSWQSCNFIKNIFFRKGV